MTLDPKRTARRAVLITGTVATVGTAMLTIPDAITQIAVFITAILASSILLFVLFHTRWFKLASAEQQNRRIWIASSATSFALWAVYWFPVIFKR